LACAEGHTEIGAGGSEGGGEVQFKLIKNDNPNKMTIEEYAAHCGVTKNAIYDRMKKGMREVACTGRYRTLRIDPVKADLWWEQYNGRRTVFLNEIFKRLKFRLKKQYLPIILAAILLILATENIATRPRQAAELRYTKQELSALSSENRELRDMLTGYAAMQERYKGLTEIGQALGLDIDTALQELQEKHGAAPPEIVLATALDGAEQLGAWIAEQAAQDRETINKYGELLAAMPSLWPVEKDGEPITRITSGYGWRRRIFRLRNIIERDGVFYEFHYGIDIGADIGTPVVATAPGEVIFAGEMPSYGNLIIVDHGYGYSTYYGHLNAFAVAAGRVEKGQVIGYVGDTGSSTGAHLHYEVRLDNAPVDPVNYLPKGEEEQKDE